MPAASDSEVESYVGGVARGILDLARDASSDSESL